ncbi:putative heterogeneous nuclear ribonucleoprotein hrp1 protein [Botrytis fragariae]|uniref:Putative heterogeneous nuclear ribonucleoprotein hrp1 protein n=1 Tax=Botrytis fragariae TaxID=1964551 RepID=A0A8H6ASR2_9HELO|nr:putative heterogeneous nuclear ribonucleoprotein hrp1 protein [Botrytis fragariae]KAF5872901.1 putative heterogeneous nuclear ribonucleoprotein hrp1 protein [Botrytis fragariae]
MAEAENFEEDLFADLYTEDDNAANPSEAVTEPTVQPSAPTTEIKAEIQAEQDIEQNPQNGDGDGDQQMYNGEQDVDEDIDFNLGSGNGNGGGYDAPSTRDEAQGPGIKEDGKMFIGGLNWETTDESLKDYFSQFGEVLECTVMRDGASGRSRGFGFLTFKDARTVNIVMVKEHYLDGKIVRPDLKTFNNSLRSYPSKFLPLASKGTHSHSTFKIDPKRAIPRDEQERTSKIFVGGVSQDASEQDFKEYFTQFGRVVDATLMMDKDTGRPRGFGFVTFDSEAAVEACLEAPLEIHGKPIEVKKAQPRGNIREEEETRGPRGSRFKKGGNANEEFQNSNQQQQGGQMNVPGGMTPQLMAQYWQRMQQYFALMQQQMAMGGGRGQMPGGMPGGMNPAMMAQMAQMQQMQQMQQQMQGGGGAGARSQSPQSPTAGMAAMASMNPAMMQQMQQMQQMQMQQAMGGQGGNFPAGGGSNPGGRMGTPGYNAYEQGLFEQQKYEQQQMRRAQREQSQYGGGGSGGGYGMGGGGGGPTSWEGMYDDVPQPGSGGGGGGRGGFGGGRGRGGGVEEVIGDLLLLRLHRMHLPVLRQVQRMLESLVRTTGVVEGVATEAFILMLGDEFSTHCSLSFLAEERLYEESP